ncbi:hypothetical protein [Nocardiopsis trehalosi]|jgi:hypothetical protein|uniref:hypothetical protein n=1 Tax=Nocardiopsis trehalosi TaxID=109329 RepID=UPI000830280C|nr:hypothetical protein [Nocardiopsis trehalosi]
MNRTSLRRLAFVAVAAPALLVGGAQMAAADSVYDYAFDAAGVYGAGSRDVFAVAGDGAKHGGDAVWTEYADAAEPHGAVSEDTVSIAE